MSDFWICFIPEDPKYMLDTDGIKIIKEFPWCQDNVAIVVSDIIQFADAGANFESVICPVCKCDLHGWWGGAMDGAYSSGAGFINLDIATPCCHNNTTLNGLDYNFPQGFYSSIIEMRPDCHADVVQIPQELHKDVICQDLFQTTNQKWRVIYKRV